MDTPIVPVTVAPSRILVVPPWMAAIGILWAVAPFAGITWIELRKSHAPAISVPASSWTLRMVFWSPAITKGMPPTLVVEDVADLGTLKRCQDVAALATKEMNDHTVGAITSYGMCVEINPSTDQLNAESQPSRGTSL